MMQSEFQSRIGNTVTQEEWEAVSVVYAHHPAISDVHGKDEISTLWKIGGAGLIRDMLATATQAQTLYQAVQAANIALSVATQALHDFEAAHRHNA